VQEHGNEKTVWTLSAQKDLFSEAGGYIPTQFNWTMFWCGQALITGRVVLFGMRMHRK
jgi:hypothetical protein